MQFGQRLKHRNLKKSIIGIPLQDLLLPFSTLKHLIASIVGDKGRKQKDFGLMSESLKINSKLNHKKLSISRVMHIAL